MNWLLIVAVVLLIWRIAEGIHRGMVKEIISFISLIVLCLVVGLLGTALSKYFEKDIIGIIAAVILLLILCIAHRLLSLVFFSAKLIAKLPVIRTADKLMGAVIGVLETVLLLWMVYSLTITFGLGTWWGEAIKACAAENSILRFFYKYNYLQHWVEFFAQKLKFLGAVL
ncbi:MAG: CvpA family protein [Lachnospiraceae bacterium]|nr:CvpA family protein [Lachnospiraceae bacterium]